MAVYALTPSTDFPFEKSQLFNTEI